MKPIVFDTVIDGVRYEFRVVRFSLSVYHQALAYKDGQFVDRSGIRRSEEDAILTLVKLLEK